MPALDQHACECAGLESNMLQIMTVLHMVLISCTSLQTPKISSPCLEEIVLGRGTSSTDHGSSVSGAAKVVLSSIAKLVVVVVALA